jgi:hypothetical protein
MYLILFKIAFLLFLILYSYFLLCNFSFRYKDEYYQNLLDNYQSVNNLSNETSFRTDFESLKTSIIRKPSIIEYVLIFWTLSLIVEEIRQV